MTAVALPLHERIRRDIEARIMSGAWEAGQRIPAEHALMNDYGCSRMTVNKAVAGLVERGLIERRRRAGSFVAVPEMHRAVIDIPDIAAEIVRQGREHGLTLIERTEREATPDDRRLLAMAAGQVLSLTCLHCADGMPFALETRLLNLGEVPAAREVDFVRQSPGRWLLGHVPWTDAEHRVTAVAADTTRADRLGLPAGAACLSIERWTWRTTERITYVRQLYPGDHALNARFSS